MIYYTYIHRRQSDNAVFYVGMGNKKRCKSFHPYARSKEWNEQADKHGVYYEVVAEWKSREEAYDHEKLLISCFRDMKHPLVNKANGGAGSTGVITKMTAEGRKKTSERMMSNKIWIGRKHKESTKQLQSMAHKGVKKEPWLCVECGKIAGGHSNIIQHQKSTNCSGKQKL
jgi:hypothetical protein